MIFRLPLLLFFIAALPLQADDGPPPDILALFMFPNLTADARFDGFHRLLDQKLKTDPPRGFDVRAWDTPFNTFFLNDSLKRTTLRIAVHGSFFLEEDGTPRMNLRLIDFRAGRDDEKNVDIKALEPADAAQIVLLKIRNFLESGMLGRLNISSTPLNLPLSLNKIASGTTPKEFFLKPGLYRIDIAADYLTPYRDQIELLPGSSVNINADMAFKGKPTHYYVLGASLLTWETLLIAFLEKSLHDEYHIYERNGQTVKADESRSQYHGVRYIRYALTGLSGMGWIGATYCFSFNKATRHRLFNKTL